MLNVFPSLLDYSFFAPTLLRLTVAVVLFYLAYQQWKRRSEIAHLRATGFPAISIVVNIVIGVALFVGYYTQIAALCAIAGQCVGLWANRRYPQVVIVPSSTVVVLIVILITIIFTGAGAFAFDLPL
ncbi:MAG TPA: hypothetical protein VMR46_02090 [Candidatus Paceibacterota bacterium]|nr:hypothetical protein [Candidatus Paceibacterota bacterium]